MKTTYVMVDFENVQPRNMGLLKGGPFRIKVFLGASQGKVSLEMAQALQAFGENAEYIQVMGNGKDALDFHIAYYIGRLSAEDPEASFSIISRDTGFDPLIKHLKTRDVECKRSASIADIPHIKSATLSPAALAAKAAPTPVKAATKAPTRGKLRHAVAEAPVPAAAAAPGIDQARVELALENLAKRKRSLPATTRTLRSTLGSLFKPPLDEGELDALLAELARRGALTFTGRKVSYALA